MSYRNIRINNESKIPFIFAIIVFSALGFGFFFGGCEENIQPNCSLYWIKHSEVTGYITKTYTCDGKCLNRTQKCTNTDGKITCTSYCDKYEQIPCYSSYDIESYTKDGKTYYCNFMASYKVLNQQDALTSAQNMYPMGHQYYRYIRKTDKVCYEESTIANYAIAGLVFLIFDGIFILLYLYLNLLLIIDNLFKLCSFVYYYVSYPFIFCCIHIKSFKNSNKDNYNNCNTYPDYPTTYAEFKEDDIYYKDGTKNKIVEASAPPIEISV